MSIWHFVLAGRCVRRIHLCLYVNRWSNLIEAFGPQFIAAPHSVHYAVVYHMLAARSAARARACS
jgi:hypothetical protein